ncbi:uncharacterized protein [Ptychodera flava]|uniref:uncharacterized protein n=1 Tax=Ptychodera flava TaxID=63121 RepID=UPI00396A9969
MDSAIADCWRCGQPGTLKCPKCGFALYCGEICLYDDEFRHRVECTHAMSKQTCEHCKKTTGSARMCASCLEAWYCGRECQTADWKRHKTDCRRVTAKIREIASFLDPAINPTRRETGVSDYTAQTTHFWGNTPAVDLLKLEQNEWSSGYRPEKLSLLLAGIGDLRYVIKTGASLPQGFKGDLEFCLNDSSPYIMARNVLFLYWLHTCEDTRSTSETLVQIWYSVSISFEHGRLLQTTLQQLVDLDAETLVSKTNGKLNIPETALKSLKIRWGEWLEVLTKEGHASKIVRQRQAMIDSTPGKWWNLLIDIIPEKHRPSLQYWVDEGLMLPSSMKSKVQVENVTLLHKNPTLSPTCSLPLHRRLAFQNLPSWMRKEKMIHLVADLIPFLGWDYLEVKAFCDVPSLQTMYANYIIHMIETFAKKLKIGNMSFRVLVCDCFEIHEHINPVETKFDRVSTSNLADYYGIPAILDYFRPFLSVTNSKAILITELINLSSVCNTEQPPGSKAVQINIPHVIFNDTGITANINSGISELMGEEYKDTLPQFIRYLRAEFLKHSATKTGKKLDDVEIPTKALFANYNGLTMCDFIHQLNSVIPFRWKANCRRVSVAVWARNLEWKSNQDTP